jgi:hypothetical protein
LRIKRTTILIIISLLFLFIWTLSQSISLRKENVQLRQAYNNRNMQNEELESKILNLQNQIDDFQSSPSISYYTYEFDRRLVLNQLEAYMYPGSHAPKISRIIEPYTVIDILGSGILETEGRELWLYVAFPVNDTPMDNRGWIREKDTVALTEENKVLVKNNVLLKKGTPIYEIDSPANIKESNPKMLLSDVFGRIDRDIDGYIYLECGGGWSFWVEKKYVVYPTINNRSL